jgi:hypothetical protein
MTAGAQAFDQADDVCNRLRAQLLHDPTALHLNCLLCSTKLTTDLLVEHSLRYPYAHLSLSPCQGFENGTVSTELIATKTGLLRSREGCVNGGKQLALIEGLREKIDRARFHGTNRVRDIGMAADENDRQTFMSSRQRFLQIEAAHLRHLKVEDNTCGAGIELLIEKLPSRRIGSDLLIVRAKKSPKRTADAQIIVDNVNGTFRHGPRLHVYSPVGVQHE